MFPDDNSDVSLASVIVAIADDVERIRGSDLGQRAPSRGRVVVTTDPPEEVYLGDGDEWLNVDDEVGFKSHLLDPDVIRSFGLEGDFDANGHDLNNVGSANVGELSVGNTGGVAFLSTDQTIPNASVTKVQLDSTTFDDSDQWDVDNFKFVANRAGKYLAFAQAKWAGPPADGAYTVEIIVNGNLKVNNVFHSSIDDDLSCFANKALQLNVGDEVELRVYQATGSNQTLLGDESVTFLSITQIG